ncbi:MAG: GLPGLI family protein [Algibacter sp.]
MKNKLITLSVFFICLVSICQNSKSGVVKYTFSENYVPQELKKTRNEIFDKVVLLSYGLEFTLIFNSEASLFFLDEQIKNDFDPLAISFAENIVSKGKYYFNKENDTLLREADNYPTYTLIGSNSSSTKWKLVNESKLINGYTCYKAIRYKTNKNNNGLFKFKIEAWYTPQIPVPFGPVEFNNLPGLILELKDTHYTFHVSDIKIENDKNRDVKKLTSKDIVYENTE